MTWKYNSQGEQVGVLKVRLYRPFAPELLLQALPASTRRIAVLDRTKEPGAIGEPLYQDIVTTLAEAASTDALPTKKMPRIIGGRYGLSSKEFTPAMLIALFEEMAAEAPMATDKAANSDSTLMNSQFSSVPAFTMAPMPSSFSRRTTVEIFAWVLRSTKPSGSSAPGGNARGCFRSSRRKSPSCRAPPRVSTT